MSIRILSNVTPLTVETSSALPVISSYRSDISDTITLTHTSAGLLTLSSGLAATSGTFSGALTATQLKLSTLNTAPASATDTGTLGEIRVTADTIYVCTATNTWAASELNSWFTLTTTATTANQVIATLDATKIRSAEFLIQGVDSTSGKYQTTKILATHNGTTVDYTEYGSVQVGGVSGTFSVDYNTGSLRLLVTPSSANSTVFKVTCVTNSI